ncbi:MAG: hypothetical protein ACYC1Z_13220 [Georgenia sp.]
MKVVDVLMELEGGPALLRALRRQEKAFLDELANALPAEGQALMNSANAKAPRGSGTLAGSSSVTTEVNESKGRVRVAAAYLDEKAAAVHEGVHWGEKVEGTKGFKWYERVLNGFEAGFVSRIGARLKRMVGGA